MKTFSEVKNFKRKIEISKFAYTTNEKLLTDIRSCLRGAEFNNEQFIDYLKVVDESAIDLSPPLDEFEKKYNTIFIV